MTDRRLASPDYHFVDTWLIAAETATVTARLRDVGRWPSWWPSVLEVEPLVAGGETAPRRWRFTFGTRLPYRMRFDAELVDDDPERGVGCRITGQVEGFGGWHVAGVAGGCRVDFDWRVRPAARWMRLVSPLARPVFGWNHRALMVEGGAALARDLRTTLVAPSTSRLLGPDR